MDSFKIIPLTSTFVNNSLLNDIFTYSGIIFSGAVTLSLTLVVIMLLTNISLAVMTRFAPQFNLFSIGINISLIMGLIAIFLTFGLFLDQGTSILSDGLTFLRHTLSSLK